MRLSLALIITFSAAEVSRVFTVAKGIRVTSDSPQFRFPYLTWETSLDIWDIKNSDHSCQQSSDGGHLKQQLIQRNSNRSQGCIDNSLQWGRNAHENAWNTTVSRQYTWLTPDPFSTTCTFQNFRPKPQNIQNSPSFWSLKVLKRRGEESRRHRSDIHCGIG